MKRIFKWLIGLFLVAVTLGVVAVVILLLSYNSILRGVMQHQIRARTGMDATIGSVNIGLLSPVAEIKDFKIRNSDKFGGAPFFDIRELHVEYDRAALSRREIHITLLRFNLGELDIVKNEAGKTNVFLPALKLPATNSPAGIHSPAGNPLADFKRQSGYEFTGIDLLDVSIGKLKYIDLKNPDNNREQDVDIENCIVKDVKTPTDLAGLAVLIALRSGDFFGPLINPKP